MGGTPGRANLLLSGPAPAGCVVLLLSANPALVSIPTSLAFPAGKSSAEIHLDRSGCTEHKRRIDCPVGRCNQTTRVKLMAPVPSALTISPGSILGGNSATAVVTLSGPAAAVGLPVYLHATVPTAIGFPANLIAPAGQTSKTFTITANPVVENTNVSVCASVSSTGVGHAYATVTVRSPTPSSLTLTHGTTYGSTGGVHAQLVMNAPAPQGGLPVQLTSSHPNLVLVPPTVTIAAR